MKPHYSTTLPDFINKHLHSLRPYEWKEILLKVHNRSNKLRKKYEKAIYDLTKATAEIETLNQRLKLVKKIQAEYLELKQQLGELTKNQAGCYINEFYLGMPFSVDVNMREIKLTFPQNHNINLLKLLEDSKPDMLKISYRGK